MTGRQRKWTNSQALVAAVVWPAAAGNVAWALMSVLLETQFDPADLRKAIVSLGYLAVLATYLFFQCNRSMVEARNQAAYPKLRGIVLDYLLAAFIALLALAIPAKLPDWGKARPDQWLVLGIYGIALFGHITFSWVDGDEQKDRTNEENKSIALGLLYVVVICLFLKFAFKANRVGTVSTFFAAIVFWCYFRFTQKPWPLELVSKYRGAIANAIASIRSKAKEPPRINEDAPEETQTDVTDHRPPER